MTPAQPITFNCPACRQGISIQAGMVGKRGRCPHPSCGVTFTIQGPAAPPPPPPVVSPPPPPASANLQSCPDCGRMVSRRAPQCPQCGAPLHQETGGSRQAESRRDEAPPRSVSGRSRAGLGQCRHCGEEGIATDAPLCNDCGGWHPNPGLLSRLRVYAARAGALLAILVGIGVAVGAPDFLCFAGLFCLSGAAALIRSLVRPYGQPPAMD